MRLLGAASRYCLALCLFLSLASAAAAQDEPRGAGSPLSGLLNSPTDSAQYSFSAMPGTGGTPDIVENSVRGTYVVHRSSADAVTLTGRAGEMELGAQPILLNSGIAVPYKLWDFLGSGLYTHQIADRRRWGVNLGFGSASDVPFNSIHELEFRASAFYQMPSRQYNAWLFSLGYSNNRTYLNGAPIPGIAYILHDPDHHFDAVIGFPFLSARWRPNDDWTFSASVTGFVNVDAEIQRRLTQRVSVYARIERQAQQWLRANRGDYSNRLVFEDEDARLGLRAKLGHGVGLDLSAGRAWGRDFFEANEATSRNVSKTLLPGSAIAEAKLSWRL